MAGKPSTSTPLVSRKVAGKHLLSPVKWRENPPPLPADFSPRVFDVEGHGYSRLNLSIRDRFIAARRQHDFAGSGTFTGDIPMARCPTSGNFRRFHTEGFVFEFLGAK